MDLLTDGVHALLLLMEPGRLVWLLAGVLLGLLVGLLPGLGGVVGLTIMFPFIYGMDPYSGVALLIGIGAVNTMSDSFPAVLFGIPGSSAAAATILDGYPLAKQGHGNRTLGTVFFVSGIGGVIGGVALFLILPVAQPIILALESPELLMLTLLGLSMVGVLARGSPAKGICSGFLGLLLSSVGTSLVGTDYRYTFDLLYLWDGVSISIVAMGLFAVPEFIDMLVGESQADRRRTTGKASFPRRQIFSGLLDAWRHRWLVVRSSLLGLFLGAIPGMGASVIQWILYGTAIQTARDKSKFGKGDIRGVIAPESAANSSEGGGMIPALFFGIPGSAGMAVLLSGFLLLDVDVGPALIRSPDANTVILLIAWTLVLANLISMVICLGMTPYMVRISQTPPKVLIPVLFVIITFAAYQSANHILDIVLLLGIGTVGWAMKQFGWSRAAALIGFVLGLPAERYLTIAVTRYGSDWILRPGVLIIGAIIVIGIIAAIIAKPEGGVSAGMADRTMRTSGSSHGR